MSDEFPETLAEAALWYVEHGFAIIPIEPRGKRPYSPLVPHGLNDWTDNPEQVKLAWGERPDLNIAIVCGTPSHGLLVLDFDVDEDEGKDGTYTLGEWETTNGELRPTVTAITGGGGMHYLYRTNRTNIRPSTNAELGVDVRCDGSYIVVPPSVHPTGSLYTWNDGDAPWECEVATADAGVYDFLDHVQRNGGTSDDQSPTSTERFELPEHIKKGDRNDTLYRYGCSLRSRGYPDDAIDAMVRKANAERCIKPMGEGELAQVIRQACKRGPGHNGEGTMRGDTGGMGKPGTSGEADVSDDFPLFRKVKSDGSLGAIQHNVLARGIITHDHARRVDGALAVWTGMRWEFGIDSIKAVCQRRADDITKSKKSEVADYIAHSDFLPSVMSTTGFDGNYYIQFANGTYDVLGEKVVEPTPEMFIVGTLPIELDFDADCKIADRFIQSVANDDAQTAKVMREVIGACMCSRQTIDQAVMCIGRANGTTAANGKSTFINVLRALLGTGNVSTLDISMFGKPFHVAGLVGKLANLGDDIPASYLHGDEASIFKRAVTGDSVRADVKYGDAFEFMPRAVQIFSMNVIPRLQADDDGLYRRLAFVPFKRHFAEGTEGYDPHIIDKLTTKENLQAFALLGMMELPDLIRRGKLSPIPEMEKEMEEVRRTNDVVRRWIAGNFITEADLSGRWVEDVYAEFKAWADKAGETFAKVNQSTFTRRVLATLAPLELSKTRDRTLGKQGNMFLLK